MKHLVITLVFTLCALNCSSQQIDSVNFNKVVQEYFLRYLKTQRQRYYTNIKTVSIADTANFTLYLPILHLKESPDTLLGYQRISPYIEKKFSPHNVYAFIVNQNGIRIFSIFKGIYEELFRAGWSNPDSLPESFLFGVSVENPNFDNMEFSYDKNIQYKQIKQYADANPDVTLFTIYNLSGIWGYRNGRLIKLIFYANVVEEMDGEEYYREYLFPLSPIGIKRIIDTNDFIIVITG